jgi:hypothetical protein
MNNNIPIEFVDNPSDKNTNNHKEYYPFLFRNDVWNVDIKWFSNAHPEIQNLFHNDMDKVKKVYSKIIDSNIVSSLPYKEATLDIYYNNDRERIYLIECNPFGAWSAAGSSLFKWKTDYDILYGSCSDRPTLRLRK